LWDQYCRNQRIDEKNLRQHTNCTLAQNQLSDGKYFCGREKSSQMLVKWLRLTIWRIGLLDDLPAVMPEPTSQFPQTTEISAHLTVTLSVATGIIEDEEVCCNR
jgi:hypothetical protein